MAHIDELYHRFLNKQCSREEAGYLLRYFEQQPDGGQIRAMIQRELESDTLPASSAADDAVIDRNRERLQQAIIGQPQVRRLPIRTWSLVAAAVLAVVGLTLYFTLYRRAADTTVLTSRYGDDVQPGRTRAYITLSNGKQIALDSTQTTVRNVDGTLEYENGEPLQVDADIEYATINTPVGGEYSIVLPDGTKAWLNATSSLKYPSRFSSVARVIEISGEVYLEVSSDKARPFIVQSHGQRIEVFGTAFNVRAYTGSVVTTLVHGKIALTNTHTRERTVLDPDQQATLSDSGTALSKVDAQDYIAWKDGFIMDKDADIREICRELERWYGVRFVFPAGFNNKERAVISLDRGALLSTLLSSLETTYGVQFSIKGKEVQVR